MKRQGILPRGELLLGFQARCLKEIQMKEAGLCLCLVQSYSAESITQQAGGGAQGRRELLSLCGPNNKDENLDSTRSFSATTTYKPPPVTEEESGHTQ